MINHIQNAFRTCLLSNIYNYEKCKQDFNILKTDVTQNGKICSQLTIRRLLNVLHKIEHTIEKHIYCPTKY